MSEFHSMKPCRTCRQPSVRLVSGEKYFCAIHYRMYHMRVAARKHKKTCPSSADLTKLVEAVVANGMVCVGCRRTMLWITEGPGTRSNVISLQHDRDGTIRLICLGCNSRHQHFPGDTFYQAPEGHKWCHGCERLLPLSGFWISRKNTTGVTTLCKTCCGDRHKIWIEKNAAMLKEKRRIRYQRDKAERIANGLSRRNSRQ